MDSPVLVTVPARSPRTACAHPRDVDEHPRRGPRGPRVAESGKDRASSEAACATCSAQIAQCLSHKHPTHYLNLEIFSSPHLFFSLFLSIRPLSPSPISNRKAVLLLPPSLLILPDFCLSPPFKLLTLIPPANHHLSDCWLASFLSFPLLKSTFPFNFPVVVKQTQFSFQSRLSECHFS